MAAASASSSTLEIETLVMYRVSMNYADAGIFILITLTFHFSASYVCVIQWYIAYVSLRLTQSNFTVATATFLVCFTSINQICHNDSPQVYDFICTLGDEVFNTSKTLCPNWFGNKFCFLWHSKLSYNKAIFILNRLLPIVNVITSTYSECNLISHGSP